MPVDKHGVTHAGSLGLFDDDEELAAANKRSERRHIEKIESCHRQLERRVAKENRKEEEAARIKANDPSKLAKSFAWIRKLFSRGRTSKARRSDTIHPGRFEMPQKRIPDEYIVMRRPSSPEAFYDMEDVVALDSPFLRECGMVQVRSKSAGGCHIVPKSRIQKSD